ncbi:MAG TPA: ABC transporter substrate-binding protein [Acidimicrobiales bacterium]|nr:ABC transporter substrate-binding protein [Acidimicrobiales bacterium]
MRATTKFFALAATLLTAASLLVAGGGSPSAYAAGSLLPAAQCTTNRAAGTMTYASPFGFDASAGILDVFAAQRLGYFSDMCLEVDIVTSSTTPYELVSAGTATVSNIGSAADDLAQVASGADIEAVATYGDTSDYALLTQPSITKLRQLEGKTFAYHSTVPVAITEMFQAAGVAVSKLRAIDTQDYDPDQLIQGHESALQAYQSNEPLTLRAQGAKFHEFTPSQFGIRGTFNVQVFNKPFLEQHPKAVADFMRAELHAFYYCSSHQSSCISIEQGYANAAGSEYEVSHEKAVWKLESALALHHTLAGVGVGVESRTEWQPEATAIRHYGLVRLVPSLLEWENTTIVASLYRGTTLVWP